ncbi:HD domain-containing protein [Candidatus Woesearchaeota archaeon]|nr:HD domain-containing protein [Candidatus Woesearchaeota archaeon]
MIPTREESIELLKKHGLDDIKIKHCEKVSEIAVFLAKKLIEKGEKIDVNLVEIAGLLHDVGTVEEKDKAEHAKAGEKILEKLNFDQKLITIVRKHLLSAIIEDPLETWEEKLVFYADKRVNSHEVRIVSLDERMHRWPDYFPEVRQLILDSIEATKQLEKEIFKNLDIKPEDIK